jgi:N utilization substance protein A
LLFFLPASWRAEVGVRPAPEGKEPIMSESGAELLRLLQSIHLEKDIDLETLFQSLEVAIEAAARKRWPDANEMVVQIDRGTGQIRAFQDGREVQAKDLGRIAAQTAKQVIIQKIREAEQDVMYGEFETRKRTLVTGTIQRFERDDIIVSLDRGEGILPRSERIRGENPRVGDRIRALILDVRRIGNRVRIILSRTHPDLIRRLFELEVPEIAEGIIEIKNLAREPGYRSKIAVATYDSKVDCVGACVGVRGSRIRNIIDELGGEKIDIIRWSDSAEVLIMNALKPAEIESITLNDDAQEAEVVVGEDMLSLAIGKKGQNVRLAAKLTGWSINIVSGADSSVHAVATGDEAQVLAGEEAQHREIIPGSATRTELLADRVVDAAGLDRQAAVRAPLPAAGEPGPEAPPPPEDPESDGRS